MPTVRLPTADVLYTSSGSGPPLVFAHGRGGNHLSWWQQVPAFHDRYTCVTFDQPGFGQSRWLDDASEDATLAGVLGDLIDHLGFDRVGLIAQSMGGWACLGLAVADPERVAALIMASTPGGLRSKDVWTAREAGAAVLEDARRVWTDKLPGSFNVAVGERCLREQPGLHYLYAGINALNPPLVLRGWGKLRAADVAGFSVPTLFLSGEEDIVIPPAVIDAAMAMLPAARLVRVPETGHSIYFERAETFNEIVTEFLDETYPALTPPGEVATGGARLRSG